MRRPVLITLAAIGGVILAAALAAPASALTRFVACDQGDNLQEAVDAATAGDVLVLTGHCEHVWIDKSLTIQGFFTSTPIIGPGFAGGPAVYVSGGTVVLENLEIEPNRIGGFGHMGMIVVGGAVTARHVLIDRGHAMGFSGWEPVGGGLRVDAGAAVTMEDSTIQFGRASDAGGGVYNAGSLTLRRTTVKSSLSTNREGGGIHNAGDALIEDSTISGNVNHRLGGGVYNAGSLHVLRSTVSGNEAAQAGGGISNAGTLTVDRSAVVGNRGSSNVEAVYPVGGGLSMGPGATAIIRTSTFAGNSAKAGGAIWNDDATVTIEASTVSGNTAGEGGSGFDGTTGTVGAESTVMAGNAGADCGGGSTWVSEGANFFESGCGPQFPGPGDHAGSDPKLAAAADNGGPTFTMRPLAGSPVVDRGRCLFPTDQRNVARPSLTCDVGAYENRAPDTPGTPRLVAGATPNRGDFTLGWDAVTDPDGDPVTYQLFDVVFNHTHGTPAGGLLPGLTRQLMGEPEGSWRYFVAAHDGNSPSPSSGWTELVVVDRTFPAAPAITADRVPEHVDEQGAAWYRDEVLVDVAPGADPKLPDGSPGSGTVAPAAAQHTFDTAGRHDVGEISADAAGNQSAPASLVVHVDTSAPEVTFDGCPAQVRLASRASIAWTAADTGAGLTGPGTGSVTLDAASVGARTARVEATDRVGHANEATCAYDVIYAFTGFDAPLKAGLPALNVVGVGQAVPVRFSLGGDHGLDVLDGTPTVTPISCATAQPTGNARDAVAEKPLSYDASKRTYTFWWQPLREWKKTCAQLAVALDDGTIQRANVSFR